MAKITRLFKTVTKLLLPIVLLVGAAVVASALLLDREVARPQYMGYLVTPEKYALLSARGAQITDEKWNSKDGTVNKGWLLRGQPNMPAVILLHRYGADRSHVLDLGVKLNEATNFTVLMPELRGHGPEAGEQISTFGGCETTDILAAVEFLKGLKTPEQFQLVNGLGIYGLEMGALVALDIAAQEPEVKAVALDSIPSDSNAVLGAAIGKKFPFASFVTKRLGEIGTYGYFYEGCYRREPACDGARKLANRDVLLLAGADAPEFQASTSKLSRCFPNSTRMDSKTDLNPSGMGIINASIETSESYDQRVIDFFRNNLSPPMTAQAIE